MSDSIEKLKEIGIQKIHEQTHISVKYVEAILFESFDGMQKVQLMGFISILEREYRVDLSELRQKAKQYFEELKEQEKEQRESSYKKELLKSSTRFKYDAQLQKKLFFIVTTVAVFLLATVLYNIKSSSFTSQEQQKLLLEEKTLSSQSTTLASSEKNVTQEQNETTLSITEENNQTTQLNVEQNATKETQEIKQPHNVEVLQIIPKKKVWFGYIELPTYKKKQYITKKLIKLDGSKEYLLAFGHGNIDIKIDDKLAKFSSKKQLKFIYKDGKLQQISKEEFKKYNRGKIW